MKNYFFLFSALISATVYAQKAQPVIQTACTSIDVDAGTHHLFSDANNKRELLFTLDGNGELKGEIIIKNSKTSQLVFWGMLNGEFLVDSAMWFEKDKLVRKVKFSDNCCSNHGDYVEPTPKHLTSIKGEKEGPELVNYPFNPEIIHYRNNYSQGRKNGKQFEYDSTGALLNKKTYLDGKLQDTSWFNCSNSSPDVEIYDADVPTGVWKKYDGAGTLIEESHRSAKGDSTISFAGPGVINSIFYKSDPQTDGHHCREYDGKFTLLKKYFIKERWDTNAFYYEGVYLEFDGMGRKLKVANYSFSKLNGDYEEYVDGKISKKGKYFHDEQIGTWFNYNAKGKVVSSETFKNKEDIIIDVPNLTPPIVKELALNVFPESIVKPVITMVFAPNGKIGKLIKKFPEIEWSLHVKTPSSHEVICEDSRLNNKEKEDIKKYLKVSVITVKTVHYDKKEVPFTMNYKLLYQ